jgi:ArsR family metal-binding transcriptional regulator
MEPTSVHETGYHFTLVNIDCLRCSTHFNVVMELHQPVEELLPYLAAVLPGCTYVHGAGVINLMDDGHIVAIYPDRITITDVSDQDTGARLCRHYFDTIQRVTAERHLIEPQYEKRSSITVLGILRHLPQTNCGHCQCPTCMAFAAKVFRREAPISECLPLLEDIGAESFQQLIQQLQAGGYAVPAV